MKSGSIGRFLGWFSIGIGLAELLAPDRFRQGFGLPVRRGVFRGAYGLREIAAGVGLLSARGFSPAFLWARVGGDLLDLGTLGSALQRPGAHRARTAAALGSVLGVTALDLLTGSRQTAARPQQRRFPRRLAGGRTWFPQGGNVIARA